MSTNQSEYITVTVPLQAIAEQKIKIKDNEVNLDIPSFQRGLVWNPAQVETLWDSIMRGIPIGCITLIKYANDSEQVATHENETYGIFDGQQRYNALRLGFKNPFLKKSESNCSSQVETSDSGSSDEEKSTSILWLDLEPQESSPVRQYSLYLTTEGQPWGYKLSISGLEANSERLNTSERNAALKAVFGEKHTIQFNKPTCHEMWPYKAQCPVPLAIMLEAAKRATTIDEFKTHLLQALENYLEYNWCNSKFCSFGSQFSEDEKRTALKDKLDSIELSQIFDGLKCALSAHTVAVVSPQEFDKEGTYSKRDNGQQDNQNDGTISNVAVFFARLNRGGTSPSVEDVNYSILKSIVPSLKKLDEIAKELMLPARLATLAMRLYLMEHAVQSQWKGSITRKDVLALAKEKGFEQFVTVELHQRIQSLHDALTYRTDNAKGMPEYVLSNFISKMPDLFLLFLTMKERACTFDGCSAFMLLGTYGLGISYKDAFISSKGGIHSLVHDLAVKNQLLIPTPTKVYTDIHTAVCKEEANNSELLNALELAWSPNIYKDAVNHTWYWQSQSSRMLLLYSCREYLDEKFGAYNPADAVWKEDNCPWDYDHIFPQSWLISGQGRTQGKNHSIVNELINCIGNIAPVPFSFNRSRKDDAPYADGEQYMQERKDDAKVLADFESMQIQGCDFLKRPLDKGKYIERDDAATVALARIVTRRMERIYKKVYDSLKWDSLLSAAAQCNKRKELFDALQNRLATKEGEATKWKTWCVASDGLQYQIPEDSYNRMREWLAHGIEVTYTTADNEVTKGLLCVCANHSRIEWGMRRHPSETQVDNNPNKWWKPNALSKNDYWKDDYLFHYAELATYSKKTEERISEDLTLLIEALNISDQLKAK